ncbi:MAG: hypothetical protein HQK81_08950 [Desulfovibrionaceae bacterium]|nr:hypothetical protein [Desulfovibrionaceae bacterium]
MAKANPGLASIFDAGPGASVNFPALAAPAPPEGVALLSLKRAENLAEAFDCIVAQATREMPLRLFATFSPEQGTRLYVIAARVFQNPEEADRAKAALPPELADKATVLTGFPRDTVFYSGLQTQPVPQSAPQSAPRAAGKPAAAPGQALPASPDRSPKPFVPGENPN